MPTTGPLVIRRSRGNSAPATQAVRGRRTRPAHEIEVTVTVRAVVVEGQVTQDHLFAWVQESVTRNHQLRAGFISTDKGKLGGIKPPIVTDP